MRGRHSRAVRALPALQAFAVAADGFVLHTTSLRVTGTASSASRCACNRRSASGCVISHLLVVSQSHVAHGNAESIGNRLSLGVVPLSAFRLSPTWLNSIRPRTDDPRWSPSATDAVLTPQDNSKNTTTAQRIDHLAGGVVRQPTVVTDLPRRTATLQQHDDGLCVRCRRTQVLTESHARYPCSTPAIGQ